jgi:DNA-binding transcriptional LysR family regulator
MSKRHPCARQSMTLKRYFSFKHIAVNYNAGSPLSYIDALLKKSNLQRDVALYVPNIRTALELIKTSELVGTFPKTLVEGLGHKNDFVFKKIPFEVSGYKIVLLHHKRWGSDPAHAWLVNVIHTIASQLGRID